MSRGSADRLGEAVDVGPGLRVAAAADTDRHLDGRQPRRLDRRHDIGRERVLVFERRDHVAVDHDRPALERIGGLGGGSRPLAGGAGRE